MPPYVLAFIEERKKFSEQRVYNAIANTSVEFVGLHLQEFPIGLKHEMQGLFENIHNSVEAGIWDGRYEIAESKNVQSNICRNTFHWRGKSKRC